MINNFRGRLSRELFGREKNRASARECQGVPGNAKNDGKRRETPEISNTITSRKMKRDRVNEKPGIRRGFTAGIFGKILALLLNNVLHGTWKPKNVGMIKKY